MLKGSPWNLVPALGVKKLEWWGYRLVGWERSLTISSAIWIQCTNVTDIRTDKRTETGRQQRPRLRIASRGKKCADVYNSFHAMSECDRRRNRWTDGRTNERTNRIPISESRVNILVHDKNCWLGWNGKQDFEIIYDFQMKITKKGLN